MRKLHLHLLILGILCTLSLNTSAQSFEWGKQIGGLSNDEGNDIVIDKDGNIYTVGSFKGTVDFDPEENTTFNLTSVGKSDIFVTKVNREGNFLWAKRMGGRFNDNASAVAIDDNGNIYTTGSFEDVGSFDAITLTSAGSENIFVSKLDSVGNILWAKAMGGESGAIALDIAVDGNANVYTTGYFYDISDFDPSTDTMNVTANGSADAFISKLSKSGNFVWIKQIGGSSLDISNAITTDQKGNIYITGIFADVVDFDLGPNTFNLTSAGSLDIFVSKIDTAGNFIWAKAMGGPNKDESFDITVDIRGNVITTGIFERIADFDPGAGTTQLDALNHGDGFVSKLDPSGNYLWVKGLRSESLCKGTALTTDFLGNIYVVGQFIETIAFYPGSNGPEAFYSQSLGGYDMFVSQLSHTGSVIWKKHLGGSSFDEARAIVVDTDRYIYMTGVFSSNGDFDPGFNMVNLNSIGIEDIFILKLKDCKDTYATDRVVTCTDYTWINGLTYVGSSSTGRFITQNAAGCDMITKIDLTINRMAMALTLRNNTITVRETNATYQWLRCDNGFAPVPNATSQRINVTDIGTYAVAVTKNACTDTSRCLEIREIYNHDSISIYPNPAENYLIINFNRPSIDVEVNLYSITGKLIRRKKIRNDFDSYLLINEPRGIYILEIINEQAERKRFKIIKK